MSDLNFVTDGTIERICRDKRTREDALREGLAQKLKHTQNHAEGITDYLRDLIKAGADVSAELKEAEAFAHSLALVVLLMKRQVGNSNANG